MLNQEKKESEKARKVKSLALIPILLLQNIRTEKEGMRWE